MSAPAGTTHGELVRVIAWAAEAAREHVGLARHRGVELDVSLGMGLWQSFLAAFPKQAGVDYHSPRIQAVAYRVAYRNGVRLGNMFDIADRMVEAGCFKFDMLECRTPGWVAELATMPEVREVVRKYGTCLARGEVTL